MDTKIDYTDLCRSLVDSLQRENFNLIIRENNKGIVALCKVSSNTITLFTPDTTEFKAGIIEASTDSETVIHTIWPEPEKVIDSIDES